MKNIVDKGKKMKIKELILIMIPVGGKTMEEDYQRRQKILLAANLV